MAKFRGNLDASLVLGSESEVKNYRWVKLEKHTFDNVSLETRVDSQVQAYMDPDWKQFIKLQNQYVRTPTDLKALIGWDKWTLLHDPTLIQSAEDLEKLKIKE